MHASETYHIVAAKKSIPVRGATAKDEETTGTGDGGQAETEDDGPFELKTGRKPS